MDLPCNIFTLFGAKADSALERLKESKGMTSCLRVQLHLSEALDPGQQIIFNPPVDILRISSGDSIKAA